MFEGPESTDYRNVRALNRAYLDLLAENRQVARSLGRLAPSLKERMTSMTRTEADRLAAAPFLLLSFRERDDDLWTRILADERSRDLFAGTVTTDFDRLRAAALGFIWQLARQNPYTLRLICGASLHWCERLAERTVFGLLAATAPYTDLPELRRAADTGLWWKLLHDGVSRRGAVRLAAHASALQTVLTRPVGSAPRAWRVAACKTGDPGLRIAED